MKLLQQEQEQVLIILSNL